MTEQRRIIVEESKEDSEFVRRLEEQIENLCGLVIEMVEEDPRTLLSPILRKMMASKAKEVKTNLAAVCRILHVDRPYKEPLQWRNGNP